MDLSDVRENHSPIQGRTSFAIWIAIIALNLIFVTAGHAATDTWSGVGIYWSNASAWTSGTVPASGDSLVFGGTSSGNLIDDLTNTSFAINGITFTSAAPAYFIQGAGFTLTGNIQNNSLSPQRIGNDILLSGTRTFYTSSGASGAIVLLGHLSGNGGIVASGSGLLALNGSNTYTGSTTINATARMAFNANNSISGPIGVYGAMGIGASKALGSSTVTLYNGAALDNSAPFAISNSNSNVFVWQGDWKWLGSQTLNLGNGDVYAQKAHTTITLSGTTVFPGIYNNLTYGGKVYNQSGGNQILTVNGAGQTLNLGGYALSDGVHGNVYNLTINGSANVKITGTIDGGGSGGNGSLTYAGSGTLSLACRSTYLGSTTVQSGVLQFAHSASTYIWHSSDYLVNQGAVFDLNGVYADIGGLSDGTNGGGGVTSNGSFAELTLGDYGEASFSGVIQDGTGGGSISLVKIGPGFQTLSGSNTFKGSTTVSNGELKVNGSLAAASAVSVAQGATLSGNGAVNGTVNVNGILKGTLKTGALSGSGLVSPGDSSGPGILTAASVDPGSGLSFAFKFTLANTSPIYNNAQASGNDLLYLAGGAAFLSPMTLSNTISLYLDSAVVGDYYLGGFFTGLSAAQLEEIIKNANFAFFVEDDVNGTIVFNGKKYSSLNQALLSVGAMNVTGANLPDGTTNGSEMKITVVPEPASWTILLSGLAMLPILRRFRRCPSFARDTPLPSANGATASLPKNLQGADLKQSRDHNVR